MSSITNIPYSAKSMNGIIVLSDGTATIENGNMTTTGNITGNNFNGATVNATTLNTTNTNITGTIDLNPVATAITINNFKFATPAQSLNTFTIIAPPYTAVTGWTIALASGTSPSIRVGRGFDGNNVNTYETLFPEYPLFTQYLSFQGATIYQMNVTQSLSFPSTGNYILTMYLWGEYNRYNVSNNLSITCGNGSISNFTAVEQSWTRVVMKFQIITAGANTLTISVNNTAANDSGLSISAIQIVKQSGLVVYDGSNTNNQLITTKGLFTNGFIYNKGSIQNFGTLQNYGPLSLSLPYSSGSLVVGSSTFGSSNSADTGRYNVIIGNSNVTSSPSLAVNLDSCVFIGYAAGEQAQNSFRNHAIGYQSLRWAQTSLVADNVGYGYQTNFGLGYSGGNNNSNVSIGNYALSGTFAAPTTGNTTVGHNSMSGVNFSNGRRFNTVVGGISLQNIASLYNTSIGYSNCNNMVSLGSNNNTFIGSTVCPTQSGSSNVLLNCTFLGSDTDVSVAGNYSNSTCVGYNSRITGNNQIILGTAAETTFAMGGLTIPVSEILTILGTMTANSLSITPLQLSYLNPLTAGIVSLAGAQTIGGIKTFSDPPVMSGASITASTIPSSAINNTSFVTLTGAQTIGGIKTFSSPPVMSGASITSKTINSSKIIDFLVDYALLNTFLGANAGSNFNGNNSIAIGNNPLSASVNILGVIAIGNNSAANMTNGTNSVFLGNNTGLDEITIASTGNTYVGNSSVTAGEHAYCSALGGNTTIDNGLSYSTAIGYGVNCNASNQIKLGTSLETVVIDGSLSVTNTISSLKISSINPTGAINLAIGNASQTTKIIGSLTINNDAQKVSGYSILSGSPNNLSKPLSEYYTLSTSSNGALTLPVIDSSMYGNQVTFIKSSTDAIWTINAGTGNTFRLYKSNSTATATSISMAYNFTVLRIVATQTTVWDVILTDIFYEAAANWVIGTRYYPMLMNPTNITVSTNWNATLPSAFYGIQGIALTATSTLTLPLSTNINVPDGLRIKFRRVGGTVTLVLSVAASTGDFVVATNSIASTASPTVVGFVGASVYQAEIYLNKTTKTWYCML